MRMLCLAVLLAASAATAQPTGGDDRVKALATEAAAHYEAGRFCEAVQAYRRAWQIEPVSELLYNIAYIHDHKLGDPDVARVYYRRYVRARDTDRETRLKAFERLDALEGDGRADEAPLERPARVLPPVGVAAPRALPGPAARRPAESPADLRTAAWVALGIGTAATVTGATFALLATHSHSQFEDAEDAAARRELADEGEQRALLGDIGLGVGLAGLAVGGVLYLLSDGQASVGAAPTDGGATFGWSGRF